MKLRLAFSSENQNKQEMELQDSIGKALENLVSSSTGTGFLNLHWLLQSMDLVLACHTEVQRELLGAPLDSTLVSTFMDDTGKLMEALNLLRLSISAAGRSMIHAKYVTRSLLDHQSKDQKDASKVKKMLQECIRELESSGSVSHTGSWPLLEELMTISRSKAARKSKLIKGRIASKASDAKLVSVLVLTALFAAFSGDKAAPSLIGNERSQRFAPGTPVRRLLEGIKEEAEVARKIKPAIVLQALCSSLKHMLGEMESEDKTGDDHGPEQHQQRMKVQVQQVSKKLEYFESGFGIVEQQLQELFAKLVFNRNFILTASAV